MERIAVIGGGIAGLAVALAEKHSGREVVLIERDPEPPAIGAEQAFESWARPGVPQFRHAHILLARLQTIVRDDHPELMAELQAAGLELSSLDEVLPEGQVGRFPTQPDDRDLLHLWGRRATLEYVMRRHVERLPHVRFMTSMRADGLVTESQDKQLRVRGVEVLDASGARSVVEADVVIDASGRRSKSPEWLQALGVKVGVFSRPSEREYVCRHYRLLDPSQVPRRAGNGGNFEYFGYATFYAEHGHYAITLSCPPEEKEFALAMRRPEGFEAVCRQLSGLSEWIDRSVPTSKVLGAAQFENRWTTYGERGGKELLGFFAVGDSQIVTNPVYGRGCSSAFVQAKLLAEVLAASSDASERARRYQALAREQLQIHFDFCLEADRLFKNRGKLSRGEAIPAADRTVSYIYNEAWTPAMHRSPLVARELIKAMQMREPSSIRVRFAMLWELLVAWLVTRFKPEEMPHVEAAPARAKLLGPGRQSQDEVVSP
jgi:2-polyprenyl-6-methoxyphenol hydroxylase-like FAD-dependent oxidoreductase